jgi:hypothetical protein
VVDPSATTDLRFSSGELERLYRRMVEIDIVDYPRDFRPDSDPTGTGTSVMYSPFESYYFRLRADGRELVISWGDMNDSAVPKAIALRDLIRARLYAKPSALIC